jgi:hypothetical protein
MIPVSQRGLVRHCDADGVTYLFKPKNARLEHELIVLYERVALRGKQKNKKQMSGSRQIRLFGAFADKILIGCEGHNMEDLGQVYKPSEVLNSFEITRLITLWTEANRLSANEKKKLVLSVLMQYNPHRSLFTCGMCGSNDKKMRGCKRAKRMPILNIPCICKGTMEKCDMCGGKGSFPIYRCPLRELEGTSTMFILPLFYHWKNTGYMQYPDNASILEQPILLREAFSVMMHVAQEREAEELEAARKKAENHE